jgi:hypothetical protein
MRSKPFSALVLGLLLLPASVAVAATSAAAAPNLPGSEGFLYSGQAYGTYVTAADTVVAGKSALTTLCTSVGDAGHGTGMAGVDVQNVITTGVITSGTSTSATATAVSATTYATVHNANLLSGLITATTVRAVSTSSHNATGFHTHSDGSRLAGLVVNGTPVASAAPNTTIRLPNVGKVVINQRVSSVDATSASLTVNMLHVYVNHAVSGVSAGTEIIVAHATSSLSGDQAGGLEGQAYGTYANGVSHLIAGRSARVFLGCGGTDGIVKTNTAAGVNAPEVIVTGTVTDTAQGTITAQSATAETTARTESLDLLAGLVTADAVKADATASTSGDQVTLSDAGSSFANLMVNGNAVASDVAPNTRIIVGNVTVWVHRVIESDRGIEVRAIEVVVNGANPYSLEVGTRIQVAVAEAAVH